LPRRDSLSLFQCGFSRYTKEFAARSTKAKRTEETEARGGGRDGRRRVRSMEAKGDEQGCYCVVVWLNVLIPITTICPGSALLRTWHYGRVIVGKRDSAESEFCAPTMFPLTLEKNFRRPPVGDSVGDDSNQPLASSCKIRHIRLLL